MTVYATTSYTRTPDGLVEEHRDLAPEELPSAIYAVEASDNGGRSYSSNGLRWVSVDDAKTWASGLAMRWFGCTNIRVVRVAAMTHDPADCPVGDPSAAGCPDPSGHRHPATCPACIGATPDVLEVMYQTL